MSLQLNKPEPGVLIRFLTFVLLTAFCVLYSGPFSKFLRAYLGDMFGVMFVYFGWRLIVPHKWRMYALLTSAFMAYGVETLQFFQFEYTSKIARFLLGSVFDWKDILMYTIGLVVAWWMDAMDTREAMNLLMRELDPFRKKSYLDLVVLIGQDKLHKEVRGRSGKEYQVAIHFFWYDQPNGAVRVSGAIDDGLYSAYAPLGYGLLIDNPNEST
jgi:hypothetical protein